MPCGPLLFVHREDYHKLISILRTCGLHGRPDLASSAYRFDFHPSLPPSVQLAYRAEKVLTQCPYCRSLLQAVSESHPAVRLQQGQGGPSVIRNGLVWAPMGA